MASTPALIGDVKNGLMKVLPVNVQYMQPHITATPAMKQAQTEADVVRFQYRPYRNGARNAPANAPGTPWNYCWSNNTTQGYMFFFLLGLALRDPRLAFFLFLLAGFEDYI